MKNILLILITAIFCFLIGIPQINAKIIRDDWRISAGGMDVERFIDEDFNVLCYVASAGQRGGISCIGF